MSDRRDRVARALYELTSMSQVGQIAWDDVQRSLRDLFLREADAAIAAMQDDEPTDTEVEWALEAWNEYRVWNMDDDRDAMRAAILAARKARKEARK